MRVLAFGGSIRASRKNQAAILELAQTEGSLSDFIQKGKTILSKGRILSNSEILAAAAMMGARSRGAELDYFPLKRLFHRKDTNVFKLQSRKKADSGLKALASLDTLSIVDEDLHILYDKLSTADGVILSTPVYFGDRSSVANKIMQIAIRQNLLRDKVFGVASVGAKRNGGQESCNIFSMIEALSGDALVVGNGPPTSQYGGTAVGGNPGHVLEDGWGLQTAFGTGVKVAHVSDMYNRKKPVDTEASIRVDIVVTMDTDDHFLSNYLKTLTDKVRQTLPAARFHIHCLIDTTIYRCLGCLDCPIPADDAEKKARVRDSGSGGLCRTIARKPGQKRLYGHRRPEHSGYGPRHLPIPGGDGADALYPPQRL